MKNKVYKVNFCFKYLRNSTLSICGKNTHFRMLIFVLFFFFKHNWHDKSNFSNLSNVYNKAEIKKLNFTNSIVLKSERHIKIIAGEGTIL